MKKRKRKRANKMNYALIVVNSKSLEISDDNLVNICNFYERKKVRREGNI